LTDTASPNAAPSQPAAADQFPLVDTLATAGSCGGCKASAALADSLTCSSCAKPYGEVGLIPRGGWATVRQLMWYAVFATIYISWLTPAFSPLHSLISKTGWEVAIRWAPTFAALILWIVAFVHGVRRFTRASTCGHCGYQIAGLTKPACPECGSDLRIVGIAVGKRAIGAFVRRSPFYTAARWITLAILALAVTLSIHAVVPLPYTYEGPTKISIPLAGPPSTTFTAECSQTHRINSTVWGIGSNKPLPFPDSFIRVVFTTGTNTPLLGTLFLGIDEDLFVPAASPNETSPSVASTAQRIRPLSQQDLKLAVLKIIPTLTDNEALFTARRILFGNRPIVSMTFPTTNTSPPPTSAQVGSVGMVTLTPLAQGAPPLTFGALTLIFVLALVVLNEVALAVRARLSRRADRPAPAL